MYVYMYECMYVCMDECIYVCVCFACTCMYVCMYVHVYDFHVLSYCVCIFFFFINVGKKLVRACVCTVICKPDYK